MYMRTGLIQALCISETLRQIKDNNLNQEETTDTENHDLLKAQTLSLTTKRKKCKEKFVEQNNLR
jgi:hypothetical protein